MCSRKELEIELDAIHPEYPYQAVANIRESHKLFHLGVKVDEGVPHSFTSVEELMEAFINFEPTDLKKALDLEEQTIHITEDHLTEPGNSDVMRLLTRQHIQHVPQEKIEHSY